MHAPLVRLALSWALLSSLVLVSSGCSPRRQWQPAATGAATTTGAAQTVAASGVVGQGTPQQQLEQLDGVLRGQQFTLTGAISHNNLPANGLIAYAIDAEANACYTLVAMGETPGQNVDMIVLDPFGRPAAHNVRPDNHPWVSFCASSPGRFIARVQMAAGAGGYYYGAYAGPAERRMELSSFFGEQPQIVAPPPTGGGGVGVAVAVGGSLQESFALFDADMRARGYESYGSQTTAELAQGGDRSFEIQLEGERCYAIGAVGDAPVHDIDLRLLDQAGHEVDRDIGDDARPTVRVCPERSGNYYMQVQMPSGAGSYIYAPYRWPRGTRGPFNLEGLTYVRLSEVTALLALEGYEPDAGFTPENGRLRREGGSSSHHVNLSAGQWYTVVVVGGQGITDIDVALLEGNMQVSSDDSSSPNAFSAVRHMVPRDGRYTINITAAAGSGPYHYQIFSRSDGH